MGDAVEVGGTSPRPLALPSPIGAGAARHRLAAFVDRLARMTTEERIRASRYSFDHWELSVWSARYPDEVPRVNGEYEWIALTLADAE